MGAQDHIEERFAVYITLGQRRIAREEGADERIAVRVQPVRGDRDDVVSRRDPRAVDDPRALDHSDSVGDEDVGALIEDARLLARLAAGEGTPLRPARRRQTRDEAIDDRTVEVAADDRVLHRERVRAHHDDVVDQVVDQVLAEGLDPVVRQRQFLLRAGLFGLEDQHRLFVTGERGVEEGGKSAEPVQHAAVARL